MAHVLPSARTSPRSTTTSSVAPAATVIGRVRIEKRASIWFGVVPRGDLGAISISPGAMAEDNRVLHAARLLKERALLGHAAVVEAATIRAGEVVGNGSVPFECTVVGEEAMVAAGSVARRGGAPPHARRRHPAAVRKELTGHAAWWVAPAPST